MKSSLLSYIELFFFNKRTWYILAVIMVLGIALRTMYHGDWLIFQSDQSRDALIVQHALSHDGFRDIPLLGPQARGSELHLGPIFYYFQYWSAQLFGFSPEALAYPDLLFGVLTILILYVLFRRFFGYSISLWLTALASSSFVLITFSRFAWNPNSLPFFTALFAFFFLKTLAATPGKRYTGLFVASLSFAVITQLHFIAALALSGALAVFIIWQRPFLVREALFGLAIIAAVSTPVLVHEFRTEGGNTRAFFASVSEKGSQDKRSLPEQGFRAFQEQSSFLWTLVTGRQDVDMIRTRGLSVICNTECQDALPYTMMAMLLLLGLAWASVVVVKNEEDRVRRQALTFFLIWFMVFFLVTVLVAYQISTRFYLGIAPVLFVLIGVAMEKISSLMAKRYRSALFLITGFVCIGFNLEATRNYFHGASVAAFSDEDTGRDLVFDTRHKVILSQLRMVAQEAHARFPQPLPILVSGESRYARSLYVILAQEYGRVGCYIKGSVEGDIAIPHVRIEHTKDTGQNERVGFTRVSFGTLISYFSTGPYVQSPVPPDCIAY